MDPTQHDLPAANGEDYGAEVLCAGWNPLVTAAVGPGEARRRLPAERAGVEVDTFLARVYHFQQG